MASNSQSYIYTTTYSDMRGVDFSTEAGQIAPHHFSYLENMYRDYACGTAAGIETVPGYRKAASLASGIHALHPHPTEKTRMLIHTGKQLYSLDTQKTNGDFPAPEAISPVGGFPLAEQRSRSTVLDGKLFLVDGTTYSYYDGDRLRQGCAAPYIPCLHIDGEPYEQKNLLIAKGYEKYHLLDLDALRYETLEGLVYAINYEGLCLVSRYIGKDETVVIPREVTLNERRYTVAGIATDAFRNNETVKTLVLPEGMYRLMTDACSRMKALETLVISSTVAELTAACFAECPALHTVYLGRGLRKIHPTAFLNSPAKRAHYAGQATEYAEVDGYENFKPNSTSELTLLYASIYNTVRYRIPLHTRAVRCNEATLDGAPIKDFYSVTAYPHYTTVDGETYADYYYLEATAESTLYGKTLSLRLEWSDTFPAELRSIYPAFLLDGTAAINGCHLIASFDGRLFLSGNPLLPGTVFYTARRSDGVHDPAYIGEYNRILDGDGATPVRALLPTPSFLLVLTEGTPHASCVFRHEGQDTESNVVPRVYPVIEGAGEIGCIGDAILFYNDPLFLSKSGLEAVEAVSFSLSQERRTVHRSTAVDARLCREKLSTAQLFRFGTYLGIATESGHVYLADGRERAQKNASTGYEWYYLSDIGVYRGQTERYRTVAKVLPQTLSGATVTVGGIRRPLQISETAEYVDGETVLSSTYGQTAFCYVVRDALPFLVDTDGECYGGSFCAATAFWECDGLLFFGTPTGELMVFNTDKRGEDGVIPRRYYTFNNRAYLSGCATRNDNCQKPNYRKTTLRSGGAVKLKSMSGGKIAVRVRTDLGVWRDADTLYGGRTDFSETDFASAEFSSSADTILPLRIGARRWLEQQLYFVSEEYQRPFGIISITYRYRLAGRI